MAIIHARLHQYDCTTLEEVATIYMNTFNKYLFTIK